MSVVQTTVEIRASPADVWKIVADPSNLPRWDHRIAGVEGLPETGLREGTEYAVKLRFMGIRATVPAKILELRSEEYAKVHLDGLVDAVVETRLEPLDGGRTRLRHRIDYRFRVGPLGGLAARAVKLFGAPILLRHGAEAQKRQVEESLR
jgi:uncharacterized protein YndB with AHSA1/START domain